MTQFKLIAPGESESPHQALHAVRALELDAYFVAAELQRLARLEQG
jgi:hypothetical protein